jgi:hypothetical protein
MAKKCWDASECVDVSVPDGFAATEAASDVFMSSELERKGSNKCPNRGGSITTRRLSIVCNVSSVSTFEKSGRRMDVSGLVLRDATREGGKPERSLMDSAIHASIVS